MQSVMPLFLFFFFLFKHLNSLQHVKQDQASKFFQLVCSLLELEYVQTTWLHTSLSDGEVSILKNPIIQIMTFKKKENPFVHVCILQALPEVYSRKQI